MSAVAQQHDRFGGDSLQDYVVFNRVTRVACAGYVSDDTAKANFLQCWRAFAFQQSRWEKVTKFSLAKCMEVQRSCSAGMDEMREMASTIKTEVLAELKGCTK